MPKRDFRINPDHIKLIVEQERTVSEVHKFVKPTHKKNLFGRFKHTDAYVLDKESKLKLKPDDVRLDKFVICNDTVYVKESIRVHFNDRSDITLFFDTKKEQEDAFFDLSNEANLMPVMAY